MAIYAGIDEAGFGPLLGPLIVSGVVFRVPDAHVDRCLWDSLRDSCTRDRPRDGRRLAVADSKLLYRSGAGLTAIERAALVMLAAAGHRPATWRGLLEVIARGATQTLERYPWYAVHDFDLPVSVGVGDIATRANAVRRNAQAHGMELLAVHCAPVPEGEFNHLVRRTGNKSVVLLGVALKIVDQVLRSGGDSLVRLCLDRLGGRTHYREALQTTLPGFDMQILEESESRSAYQLSGTRRVCRIEFVTGGESRHFPIAMASIYSKYLRELYMHAFNRYWSEQAADLRPTAGYYTDAQRWLRDASPVLERLAVDRDLLVRTR